MEKEKITVEGEKAGLKPFIRKSLLDFYGTMPVKRKYPGLEAIRRELHQKISKTIFPFDRHFDRVAGIERLEPLSKAHSVRS